MKNNTHIAFGISIYGDDLDVYASKEKVWSDITAFAFPKGSPLTASVKIVNFDAYFQLAIIC